MLWDNTAYGVNLSGKDVLSYSNKTESVHLTKCPYYQYGIKKVMSQQQTLLRACSVSWQKKLLA